jgi:hypothetical protein
MGSRLRLISTMAVVLTAFVFPDRMAAQDQLDEWFYLPGSFNWQFLSTYPSAARLFNAFDYGHAVLYERLYTQPDNAAEALNKEYRFLTTDLLVRPPRFAVAEEVVAPAYAKAAWRAKQMFDWAHLLHRQIYDVYSDDRLSMATKDSLIERLTDYYLRRPDYAFAPVPKSMDLMEGQYFSRTFREAHPRFNGLIWAYHWLQVGLYEPLIAGKTPTERKAGMDAAVARFWSMLEDPPSRMPQVMPMTSAIAPGFSQQHPRAAAIFDNLHMMHDIISDILVADTVPHGRKRALIYAQLDELRDSTRNVMSWEEWRMMGDMMGGVAVMGGPSVGLVANPPTAGTRAGTIQHDPSKHQQSGTAQSMADSMPMDDRMPMNNVIPPTGSGQQSSSGMHEQMMALYRRMMSDTVIRQRIMADSVMRMLTRTMMDSIPAEHDHQPQQPKGKDSHPKRPAPVQPSVPVAPSDSAAPPHQHTLVPRPKVSLADSLLSRTGFARGRAS